MQVGVVVTTYNSPKWLEKVFWGYLAQTDKAFELIVADDGSGMETKQLIARYSDRLNIRHVWHEDDGFRKTEILNKAIVATQCDYLIFNDGDSVPRADYIEMHKKLAKPGCFVSGGLLRLNMPVSQALTEKHVLTGKAFDRDFLESMGQPKTFKNNKLTKSTVFASLLNRLTPTKATWNGGNSSGWKADIEAVNGFNEQMQYGGLDRELGERLVNNGIKGIQARYSVILLHLDHARGYERPEIWAKNNAIRAQVRDEKLTWTEHGIRKIKKV